jgi:hypothetical protein
MPSFEEALTRVRPLGAQLVALQDLRPTPGTYQVRVLPPSSAAASSVDGSNRNQPRTIAFGGPVIRPFGRAVAIGASVPFTNIVNNPGTDAVQPLMQTP